MVEFSNPPLTMTDVAVHADALAVEVAELPPETDAEVEVINGVEDALVYKTVEDNGAGGAEEALNALR